MARDTGENRISIQCIVRGPGNDRTNHQPVSLCASIDLGPEQLRALAHAGLNGDAMQSVLHMLKGNLIEALHTLGYDLN